MDSIERGVDYILALKGNQPEMNGRVADSFTYHKPSSEHIMEGKSHGREETRVYTVITDLENILDRDKWAGLFHGVKGHRKKVGWDNDYLL